MNKPDKAVNCFEGPFNCAQSVFTAFAPELGLDRAIALRIAAPFGAGMAYMGEVCGSVTGALMVIGLRYGMSENGELEAKERAYALSQDFAVRFTARNGSTHCSRLIGFDLSVPEQYGKAKEEDVFNTHCTKYVRDAVEILEELLRSGDV